MPFVESKLRTVYVSAPSLLWPILLVFVWLPQENLVFVLKSPVTDVGSEIER